MWEGQSGGGDSQDSKDMNQVKEAVLVTQGVRREGAHPRRTLLSASSTMHAGRSAWHLPASTAHLMGAALLQGSLHPRLLEASGTAGSCMVKDF